MKIIKGDLILTKDTTYDEDLKVEGNIICKGRRWDLNCRNLDCWNLNCLNLDCCNLNCWNLNCNNLNCNNLNCLNLDCCNLNCWNLDCRNLDCWNLDCRNLDCWNVVCCDKIKVKKGCKVKCKFLIKNRFSVEQKEWKIEEKRKANEKR